MSTKFRAALLIAAVFVLTASAPTTAVRMLSALIGLTAGRAWANNFETGKQDQPVRGMRPPCKQMRSSV